MITTSNSRPLALWIVMICSRPSASAPDPDADGRLQIMTIHKAKGLEFDVVIIPQLARSGREDDERLLLWHEHAGEDGPELLLAPVEAKGKDSDPLYGYLARV